MKERLSIKSPNASIKVPWDEGSFGEPNLSELERLAHGICDLLQYYDSGSVQFVLAEALSNWAECNAEYEGSAVVGYHRTELAPLELQALVELHDAVSEYLHARAVSIAEGVATMTKTS